MAIVVSCICRSMDYDEDDADEDEEDPHLQSDEEYLHDGEYFYYILNLFLGYFHYFSRMTYYKKKKKKLLVA